MGASAPAAPLFVGRTESAVQITLLGPPEVTWQGRPVIISRRQSRALFYRLASTSQPVPREQLCFLFWPDTCEATARRNLTVLLNHLRRELPSSDLIVTIDDALALDWQIVWTDAQALAMNAAALLHEPSRSGRTAPSVEDLQAMAALYRGPFLHGFALPASVEFESWAAHERQVWERRYLDIVAALVELHIAQGDFLPAIAAAQRYLAVDALAENMHRRLIWLYAAVGDRPAALQQFDRCVALLERDLDVSPLPETWALYEAVRGGEVQVENAGHCHTMATLQGVMRDATHAPVPTPQNPLLGRSDELAAVCTLLRRRQARLLTLIGPGGSGKTHLALVVAAEVAADFTHGAVFADLGLLADPALVLNAIARACGVQEVASPDGSLPPANPLYDYLRDKHLLLVLDNFEHLLSAATDLADLLALAPSLHILVTSRTALHLSGEHLLPVPPLPLPDLAQLPTVEQLAGQPAVALLLARSQAQDPAFQITQENAADLATICVRLDGLPLAIELAAARLRLLTPHALLQRLQHRLALLTNGPRDLPLRQQTMRATISWSYDLLAVEEQRLFNCLAVFSGGFTLEAAESIVGCNLLDSLASLVDKSLLRQELRRGELYFTMLETIREYALERLVESGEAAIMQDSHARYYLDMAEAADLEGQIAGRPYWLDRLELEYANLAAVLAWSLEASALQYTSGCCSLPASFIHEQPYLSPAEIGVRLATALWPLWYVHGHLREGRDWLSRILATPACQEVTPGRRAGAYIAAGWLAKAQGDYMAGRTLAETGLALCEALADEKGRANALSILGDVANGQGDYALAYACYSQSLGIRQSLGNLEDIAISLRNLGSVAIGRAEYTQATALFEESLALFRKLGDKWGIAQALYSLGEVAHHRGDFQPAAQHYGESLALYREMGNRWRAAWIMNKLGEVAQYQGDFARARALYEESLALCRKLGSNEGAALVLHNLGYEMLQQGDPVAAQALHQESLALFEKTGVKWGVSLALGLLGVVAAVQGDYASATRLQQRSLALWQALGSRRGIVLALNRLGDVALHQQDNNRAIVLHQASLALAWELNDCSWIVATSMEGMAAAFLTQGEPARAAILLGAAEALRETLGSPLRQVERTNIERTIAAARSQLDGVAFPVLWMEGRTAPLARVIAGALGQDQRGVDLLAQAVMVARDMVGSPYATSPSPAPFRLLSNLRKSHVPFSLDLKDARSPFRSLTN